MSWVLGDVQAHLTSVQASVTVLPSVVHGRLGITKTLQCLPKKLGKALNGQAVRTDPTVFHLRKNFE
uniref:Uncharacterized protein n=1 Tax=Arundo donax TaxID=35708 RepID=A0A0A8Y6L4_ARUDO